ncbi:MAG: FAD binding domain-containing protein [Candidatus Cloacimonetes bacterium]|nr:FAD binding domain-containing protein [Candidatus Cloacimonadota bacterium]
MRFDKFIRPDNLQTALKYLQKDKDAVILGGNTFLRLSERKYTLGIDISNLKLDYIKESKEDIEIGAFTSLRTIETDPIINKYFSELLPESVKHLIGVQFRNNATIGGAIYSRLGFSEINTALLVLDCELEFEDHGRISFNDFISSPKIKRDILTKIIVKKQKGKSTYTMMRNANSDFSILSVAVSNFGYINIAVGNRPALAKLPEKAMKLINSDNSKLDETADLVAEELSFGDDLRAKSSYRKLITSVLVNRALRKVLL